MSRTVSPTIQELSFHLLYLSRIFLQSLKSHAIVTCCPSSMAPHSNTLDGPLKPSVTREAKKVQTYHGQGRQGKKALERTTEV